MATNIRKVALEVCGVTKGSGREDKDTWWWNEEVQRAIKEMKECYRRWYYDRSVDNIEKYKVAKKTSKRAVSVAKGRAYEDLYQYLSTKEERRTFIGLLGFEKERQGTSTKLSALRMKMSISW